MKQKLFKPFLSRLVIVIFVILIQVLWFSLAVTKLLAYSTSINMVLTVISIGALLYIVNKDENPAYKLAWVIPIALFPVFGGVLYLFYGDKRPTKGMRRRMDKAAVQLTPLLPDAEPLLEQIKKEDKAAYGQMKYINDCAGFPAYQNTRSTYFSSGEECFPVLLERLRKAEKFIFLEYFIIEEDSRMWTEVLEILKEKAAQGVDVRLLYDDMGSVSLLPWQYYRKLETYGIQCEAFNHVIPVFSVVMNNRDHRKITVIDGHTGFTGGWNFADEYINEKERFGYWKDSGVMLEGAAVWNLTVMFLEIWTSLRPGKREDFCNYMPSAGWRTICTDEQDGWVQPYGDTPLDHESVSESVYLNMIHAAQDYIYITTPYLIIDNEMNTALILAAKRGVDVRILTPGIPDKKYVFWLTQSYYAGLTEGGVKIYEFDPGFVHAKSFVCDDKYAIVGTINMDFRSLFLHFECGVWFYRSPVVQEVKKDILSALTKSTFQTKDMTQRGVCKRLTQAVLRVFAPLL